MAFRTTQTQQGNDFVHMREETMLVLCRVTLGLLFVGVVNAFSVAIRTPHSVQTKCCMSWHAKESESPFVIAPSILSANFAKLGEEVDQVLDAGADVIHFDVMDSHYVPTLTLGPMVCRALRQHGVTRDIDVHLMTTNVDPLIRDFAHAGASYITFHPETTHHVDRSLQLIRSLGCRSGLALNPSSSLELCRHVLDKVDLLVIMAVNPGFPGQQFLPSSYGKLREARKLVQSSGFDVRIEVDGGVSARNIRQLAEAGADTFVAGSAIFGAPPAVSSSSPGESNGAKYRRVIEELRSELPPLCAAP